MFLFAQTKQYEAYRQIKNRAYTLFAQSSFLYECKTSNLHRNKYALKAMKPSNDLSDITVNLGRKMLSSGFMLVLLK